MRVATLVLPGSLSLRHEGERAGGGGRAVLFPAAATRQLALPSGKLLVSPAGQRPPMLAGKSCAWAFLQSQCGIMLPSWTADKASRFRHAENWITPSLKHLLDSCRPCLLLLQFYPITVSLAGNNPSAGLTVEIASTLQAITLSCR